MHVFTLEVICQVRADLMHSVPPSVRWAESYRLNQMLFCAPLRNFNRINHTLNSGRRGITTEVAVTSCRITRLNFSPRSDWTILLGKIHCTIQYTSRSHVTMTLVHYTPRYRSVIIMRFENWSVSHSKIHSYYGCTRAPGCISKHAR